MLLQAFLQRVVNGGGRVEREYALGRGRTDPLLFWPQGVRPNLKCLVLANLKCCAPCQGTAPQRGVIPPGNCRSSRYVEFGGRWSWTGQPLPHNALGEVYSAYTLLGSGP